MSGLSHLKRAYDNDKLTSHNLLTLLNSEFPNQQVLFGTHTRYLPNEYNKNFEHITLEQILKTKC